MSTAQHTPGPRAFVEAIALASRFNSEARGRRERPSTQHDQFAFPGREAIATKVASTGGPSHG